MSSFGTLISELEEAIHSDVGDKRTVMLRRVTDLFAHGANDYSEDQVALFGDVIARLADGIETRARAELSNRIAPIANAPMRVLDTLSTDDDIKVAGPVLSQSERISDTDLVRIINSKSQGHLLAISSRQHLGEDVTDALVERGDQQVVRATAQNAGAHFSGRGFETLVKRSQDDDILAVVVGLRDDLPREQFRNLFAQASATVQQRLAGANPHLSDDIAEILARIAAENASGQADEPRDYLKAKIAVEAMFASKALGENQVALFARNRQFEETVAALSMLCGIPIETVERAFLQKGSELVLILVRSLGFSFDTTKEILRLCAGSTSMSSSAMKEFESQFNKLQVATAQRVIRFYKVRRTVGGAPVH